MVSLHGDGVRLHGMRPGCQTPSGGAKKLTPRYGAALPDGGRILPAVLAGDVCRQAGPMPEGLDHCSAVERDNLLALGGSVHEGLEVLPGLYRLPPVFDHADR